MDSIRLAGCITACLLLWPLSGQGAEETTKLLPSFLTVQAEGQGNEPLTERWKQVVAAGPQTLLPILNTLDEAYTAKNRRAANYLRTAYDAILEKAIADGVKLPAKEFERFTLDVRHAGPARRLAFETLVQLEPAARDRLLEGMLNDPGQELRRDAIERRLTIVRKQEFPNDKARLAAIQPLFDAARDVDQVEEIAKELEKLGQKQDMVARFGFITQWDLLASFDNTKGVGFEKAYAPEAGVDLNAKPIGKAGEPLKWQSHVTKDARGMVDLNAVLGETKAVVAYAYAEVDSPKEQTVEFRAGSQNAIKIFLNGKVIFAREEYHHGTKMDQHIGIGTLKPGKNAILVKVCQNAQTEDWARKWGFQLRLCDALGGPVPFKTVTPDVSATK